MNRFSRRFCSIVALTALVTVSRAEAEVRLAENGRSHCVIVAPSGSRVWEGSTKELIGWNPYSEETERRRRLLRDSIEDLAACLGKISGAKIEVVEALVPGDKRVPILIGSQAQKVYGPIGKTLAELYAFRVVANPKGIGLYGESEYGTSYAIYELLHRLGARWYFPSELGETLPYTPKLTAPDMDLKLAPATEGRRMERRTADEDFRRRNRMNGTLVASQHTLEGYITAEQRIAHPEWRLVVNGQPHPTYLRWTRQDVADAIGDAIIKELDKAYEPTVSLSPGDYIVPTDDPEEMKHDPTPRVWEPAAKQWSVTDRLILLANRVAERVGRKYPKVRFGLLVYVNYSMPPAKYKVHPNIVPMIAPIDFNRQHPMNWPDHPNDSWLIEMVKGWGKASSGLSYYAYGMNLSEITAPNPFITKWGADIPIVLQNNTKFWAPETMGGWESMMPGFYLSTRITFHPEEKPEAILEEMWQRLYGHASQPMSRYWHRIDRAWIDAKEYSGGGFGYLRIFTPAVMKGARADIDEALSKVETVTEYRRVKMIAESFSLFELFMKMQQDWAEGRVSGLGKDLENWRSTLRFLRLTYKPQYAFDSGLALDYVNWFWGEAFDEATRKNRELEPLGPPLLKWAYEIDPEKKAEEWGWTKPEFDDTTWKTTEVVKETWSSLGQHNYMGRMAYRCSVQLAALPTGKKAYAWIGSFDGRVKLFVNGTHVKYVVPEKNRQNEKGDIIDAPSGFGKPATFDVTQFLKPGTNQITILADRNWLNEVGTGGLMGPVLFLREK